MADGIQDDSPYTPSGADYSTPGAPGADASGFWNFLSGLSPQAVGSLIGTLGPIAGLVGTISGNGQTGTQRGQTNQSNSGTQSGTQSGSQSGTNQSQTATNQVQNSAQTGYANTNTQQTLDPAAQAAMDRLTGMLNNGGGAQTAYNSGLSMLQQLASGAMGRMGANGSGASPIGAPNTTPSPQAVTGFPQGLPTEYNPAIGNLIKQAMGSFVGDLGSQAITNARARGFAGGTDLLGSAAAPMMGQSLAQVPAMEAKAYLDHVLQAYGLQTQNASAENAARAGALNAATNALGPGIAKYGADVSKYGIDRNADNAQLGQMTSLLQALMGPQQALMTGNLNLLNAAPRGSQQNTLTGNQGTQTLSGLSQTQGSNQSQFANQNASQSASQQSGNTQQQGSVPLGPQVGQGLANVAQGAATGYAAVDAAQQRNDFNNRLLDVIARRS